MSYSRLVVPSEKVHEQYRASGIVKIRQLPFYGATNERLIYVIDLKDSSRRQSKRDPCKIKGLELVFRGVNQRFVDRLHDFARDSSSGVTIEPQYTNPERLLGGIIKYMDPEYEQNLRNVVRVSEDMQLSAQRRHAQGHYPFLDQLTATTQPRYIEPTEVNDTGSTRKRTRKPRSEPKKGGAPEPVQIYQIHEEPQQGSEIIETPTTPERAPGIEGIVDDALNLAPDSIAYNSTTHLKARKLFAPLVQLYESLPRNAPTIDKFKRAFTNFQDQLATSKETWGAYAAGIDTEGHIEDLMMRNVRRLFSGLEVWSLSVLRYLKENPIEDYPRFDRFERK